MSELSKALDLVLKEYVSPVLKNAGFKKSGRKYKRFLKETVDTIAIESSSWNRGDEGTFSIFLTAVRADLLLRKSYEDFDLSTSRGSESGIMHIVSDPAQKQFLFSVDAAENIQLGKEIGQIVEAYCLKWFEKTRKDSSLIELLEEDKSIFALETLSILYMRNGFRNKCNETLQLLVSRRPDILRDVKDWANQKGLYFECDA